MIIFLFMLQTKIFVLKKKIQPTDGDGFTVFPRPIFKEKIRKNILPLQTLIFSKSNEVFLVFITWVVNAMPNRELEKHYQLFSGAYENEKR